MADPGAPRTWTAGETVTDTIMNEHVRDQLVYLRAARLRLTVDTTQVGNVGAGEDDLMTYTLPAGTLSQDGYGIRFLMAGSTAANANNKTIKLYWDGASAGALVNGTHNNLDWLVEGMIIRTGATAQIVHGRGQVNAGVAYLVTTTDAATLSGAVILKLTGEATANDDIVQNLMLVEMIR